MPPSDRKTSYSATAIAWILRPTWKVRLFFYLLAILWVAIFLFVKVSLHPLLEQESPFVLFIAAVLLSATVGGTGPGLVATLLTALCADFFFMPPLYSILEWTPEQSWRLGQYVLEAGFVSWVAGVMRRSWAVSEESRALVTRSEISLRTLLECAADAIFTVGPMGVVQTCNSAAERIYGYNGDDLVGRHVDKLLALAGREERDGFLPCFLETAEKQRHGWAGEALGQRKDGTLFPAELTVSVAGDPCEEVFTFIVRDITERRERDRELLNAIEREQRRIGQDLHDDVGQLLTAASFMADNLLAELGEQSPQRELAERIAQRVRESLRKVRALSHGLMPEEVDAYSLVPALKALVGRVLEQGQIRCSFSCVRQVPVADNVIATNIYRIAQEAVTNALKHAGAQHIHILLAAAQGLVTLQVSDDGAGIKEPNGQGLGLKIMRYRARLIGGNLNVERGDVGGTVITCSIIRETNHGSGQIQENSDRG